MRMDLPQQFYCFGSEGVVVVSEVSCNKLRKPNGLSFIYNLAALDQIFG